MYKNKNYKSKKNEFLKKCKKYDIDKRLVKRNIIKYILPNKKIFKKLIMIPSKYINEILNYFHRKNGHIKKFYCNCQNYIRN